MDYAVVVGVIEAVADLAADVEHVPDGVALAFGDSGRNAESLNVFGGNTETSVDFTRTIEQDDVLVSEVARALRFLDEALDQVGTVVAGEIEVESFERDGTVGGGVRGAVDGGLLGVRDFADDFETPDLACRHAGPRNSKLGRFREGIERRLGGPGVPWMMIAGVQGGSELRRS